MDAGIPKKACGAVDSIRPRRELAKKINQAAHSSHAAGKII
jgi:hypothetical protein